MELFGGYGNDLLIGSAQDDTLNGGFGYDTLRGNEGDDTYFADDGYQDRIERTTGGGIETIFSDEEDILVYGREHLAGYKIPRSVSFADEIPRNASGKILKKVLREPFWAGRATRV